VASVARVGGGAVPLLELESFACALDGGDALAAALRASDPPVVAVVREGRVLLDCRTLTDDQCLQISL
jgi:L-seryl-tRNA(Ser) seleniumtransferase